MALQVEIDLRERGVWRAVRPDCRRAIELWKNCRKRIHELAGHDEMLETDDVDAMRKGGADKIGVEQRDDAAHTRDAEPDGKVLGAIGHQQADDIAFGQTLLQRPASVLICARHEFRVGHALAI